MEHCTCKTDTENGYKTKKMCIYLFKVITEFVIVLGCEYTNTEAEVSEHIDACDYRTLPIVPGNIIEV